ncbi:hypothetical protein [Thermococcus cleftensis]|uniref:hypothetical protein n=1 Tax=Thermococcus cleftensis (strain DSM 27260 / KACC 17922 / CL1) TaxID=163003 RepID=UPI00064FA23B|nr:hypothetical protein [Thermococcus cleftensis]
MDWQSFGANLIISAIATILLILANWVVNAWDRHSGWGQWKQTFLRYSPVLSVYVEVQKQKIRILEKWKTIGGLLFFVLVSLNVFEMIFVPLLPSWWGRSPDGVYSLLLAIYFLLELLLMSSVLTRVLLGANVTREYHGVRFTIYSIYLSAIGIILAGMNLKRDEPSSLFGLLVFQAIVVGIVALAGKYLELSLFNILWNKRIKDDSYTVFPYLKLTLKSGRVISGRLVDFMDRSNLVIKHGREYIHVPWNEVEVIHILDQ